MSKGEPRGELPHVAGPDRDYLTPAEANRVIAAAAKLGRQGLRDHEEHRRLHRH